MIYDDDFLTPRGREFTWIVLRWNCVVSPLFALYAMITGHPFVAALGVIGLTVGSYFMVKLRKRLFSDAVATEADEFLCNVLGEPFYGTTSDSNRYLSLREKMRDNAAETEGGSEWFFEKFGDERFGR